MTVAAAASVRDDLARAIVEELGDDSPTLVARLIAMAFAARFTAAISDGGFLQLALWAVRTCERYGAVDGIAPLLANACTVTRRLMRARHMSSASLESDLTTLDAAIAAKLAEPVRSGDAGRRTPSDGIDGTIAAFLVKLDDADPLSAEHSRAVSLWCRRLARRMNLSEERGIFVSRGGLLHDVGKTTTPRDILLAPRSLTDAEFAIIQDHASAGAAMVSEVERLRPFMPMVRSHHERLDGKGYPDRLAGGDISLDVRIVTVADCFNAMIGRRPYRQPMSPASAIDQLTKHSGTQFDPLVVEAMIDVVEHPDD